MITGDGNLVEVQATVRYTSPTRGRTCSELATPTAIIRSAAESVLRELVAGRPFLDLLTSAGPRSKRGARPAAPAARCTSRAGGLGVALDGLSLHDLHPPQEVVTRITRWRRRSRSATGDQRGRGRRLADEAAGRGGGRSASEPAQADAPRPREEAAADRDAFLAWHAVRNKLAPDEEAMHRNAERDAGAKAGESLRGRGEGTVRSLRDRTLAERRFLIEQRLTLQAVVDVLQEPRQDHGRCPRRARPAAPVLRRSRSVADAVAGDSAKRRGPVIAGVGFSAGFRIYERRDTVFLYFGEVPPLSGHFSNRLEFPSFSRSGSVRPDTNSRNSLS